MRVLNVEIVVTVAISLSVVSANSFDILKSALNSQDKRDAFSDCLDNDFSAQCSISPASCVAAMCQACQGVAIIAECCGLATDSARLVCFNNAMANPAALTATATVTRTTATSLQPANSITIAPTIGLDACGKVLSARTSCQSKNSDFSLLPLSQQAACLCYKSGSLNASMYDGPWSTCLAYASATSPALYSSLAKTYGSDRAPCSKMATLNPTSVLAATSVWYIGYTVDPAANPGINVVGQTSASPVVTTTAAAVIKTNSGCRWTLNFKLSSFLPLIIFAL